MFQSGLEEEMDSAIERGEFAEAAAMSDRLMQRKVLQYYLEQRPVIYHITFLSQFATQVATAFDCHEFVKRKKVIWMYNRHAPSPGTRPSHGVPRRIRPVCCNCENQCY